VEVNYDAAIIDKSLTSFKNSFEKNPLRVTIQIIDRCKFELMAVFSFKDASETFGKFWNFPKVISQ